MPGYKLYYSVFNLEMSYIGFGGAVLTYIFFRKLFLKCVCACVLALHVHPMCAVP